jgi:hypothetical protein
VTTGAPLSPSNSHGIRKRPKMDPVTVTEIDIYLQSEESVAEGRIGGSALGDEGV